MNIPITSAQFREQAELEQFHGNLFHSTCLRSAADQIDALKVDLERTRAERNAAGMKVRREMAEQVRFAAPLMVLEPDGSIRPLLPTIVLPARRYKQGYSPENLEPYSSRAEGWDDALDACERAIKAAGIEVGA